MYKKGIYINLQKWWYKMYQLDQNGVMLLSTITETNETDGTQNKNMIYFFKKNLR